MSWRIAHALETLRDEINAKWPNRDKASDGAIGDAAHASTGSASDHNPWIIDNTGMGVVRAYDIDVDLDGDDDGSGGAVLEALAESIRLRGMQGDARLANGGYLILNRRIASTVGNWQWRPYDGADPHTSHFHLSVSRLQSGYDDTSPWLTGGDPMAQPTESEELTRIKEVQATQARQDPLIVDSNKRLREIQTTLGEQVLPRLDSIENKK